MWVHISLSSTREHQSHTAFCDSFWTYHASNGCFYYIVVYTWKIRGIYNLWNPWTFDVRAVPISKIQEHAKKWVANVATVLEMILTSLRGIPLQYKSMRHLSARWYLKVLVSGTATSTMDDSHVSHSPISIQNRALHDPWNKLQLAPGHDVIGIITQAGVQVKRLFEEDRCRRLLVFNFT